LINYTRCGSKDTTMEHQDWTPIYKKASKHLDKATENNKSKSKSKSNSSNKTSHSERKLDEAVSDGQLAVKKFDATFGKDVQRFRAAKGWKQAELAQKLNVNQIVINEIEAGKAKYNPALMSKIKRLLVS
jgi:ribosome-binding protein aMBF1 (putative translation factor)